MSRKIGIAILIVSLVAAAIAYPFLPDPMPIHFDSSFNPNSYASKNFIFLIALLPFVIYTLLREKYKF